MQLILSAPAKHERGYPHTYNDLIRNYFYTQNIFLFSHEIEVGYNTVYNFWDISIFRYSNNTAGSGTRASRDAKWEKDVNTIKRLFPDSKIDSTWRWVNAHKCYDVPQDFDCIPGVRFFVKANTVTLKLD